jgi:hypothetical protein
MKLLGLFLFAQLMSASAIAGDLYLSCDDGRMRSSGECEAAMQTALSHLDCHVAEVKCQSSNQFDGYDCKAQSDVCVSPNASDTDDENAPPCPAGYTLKYKSRWSGDTLSRIKNHQWSQLTDSRVTAEDWTAETIGVCRRN